MKFILSILTLVIGLSASADGIKNHCESNPVPYDFYTQYSLLRSYLIKSGLDASKLELGMSSNYPEPLFGLLADLKLVTWPVHQVLSYTGVIHGREALFDTFGSIVNYGAYRIVCTTTINRFRDTPDRFELNIGHCVTLANHDVDYFESRHLDASRAKACVTQVGLAGVENPTPFNTNDSVSVSGGQVTLSRNDTVLDACSLTAEEFKNRPIIATEESDLDYRKVVCE